MNTKIINILGGSGIGKSTFAAELFTLMKKELYDVELALEYAKDLVYENRLNTLENQIYVFGKQLHRIQRLVGKVEYIITDSPIILSSIYGEKYSENFHRLVLETFNQFSNINILLKRGHDYNPNGRLQTLEEAIEIDRKIAHYLIINSIDHYVLDKDVKVSTHLKHLQEKEEINAPSHIQQR